MITQILFNQHLNQHKAMALTSNQQAPDFNTTDVYGAHIQKAKFAGKKIYLAFERNVGCPVCNLRTHELLKHTDYFSKNNIVVLMIYESTQAKMIEYLDGNKYSFHFIADPENVFYKLYNVEQSMMKILKGIFHGLLGKANAGKKLFKKPTSQDGHTATIPSEFLIDEHGKLIYVHYGKFLGDHLPLKDLQTILS